MSATINQSGRLDAGGSVPYDSGMDYIDFTQIPSRRKPTRDEFLRECAERSHATPEHILEYHDIQPCACAEPGCPGWKAVYLLKNRREARRRA